MLLNRNLVVFDVALLLIRLIVGVVFLFHGSQKLFGAFDGPGIEGFAGFLEELGIAQPLVMAWLTAIAEFVGGALLFVGLLARITAIGPLIVMAVAITYVHSDAFAVAEGGMEFALTLAVVLFALMLAGPGRFSIDGFIMRACCGPRRTTSPTEQNPPPNQQSPPPS